VGGNVQHIGQQMAVTIDVAIKPLVGRARATVEINSLIIA